MKKIISIILCILLCVGVAGGTFALARHIDSMVRKDLLIVLSYPVIAKLRPMVMTFKNRLTGIPILLVKKMKAIVP
jgi:hypothetical protein